MMDTLYKYMDWPRIEAIVYGGRSISQRCDGAESN